MVANLTEADAPNQDKEDILAGLDATIDSLARSGDIKFKHLPPHELERMAKQAGISTVAANAPVGEKEQAYINILKKTKPAGQDAVLTLHNAGEDVHLKLGRSTVLNGKCYTFSYETASKAKIFSTITQENLEKLKFLYGFNHEKAYVTLLYEPGYVTKFKWVNNTNQVTRSRERPRYTYVVTGTRNGKPYAFSRKETASTAAGQTKVYGPAGVTSLHSVIATGEYGNQWPDKQALLASIGL